MSRSRWTPFFLAALAGAAAWAAWRFLPRDRFRLRRGGAPARPRTAAGGPGSAAAIVEDRPWPPRPTVAPAGTAAARVVEPVGGETLDEAPAEAAASATAPPRCAAVTQSGNRCSREVEPGSAFCWQHGSS